jgi:23S rRNA (uracil1939-C5)-methyltransferase
VSEIVTVPIDSIATGGDGVGRSDGLVVFVPRTAPGDIVNARISEKRNARFARGTLAAIGTASPDRIEPQCEHYTRDYCGGCQIQHLSYESQLLAKRRIIGDAVQRIAKRDIASLAPVRPSPKQWRYRTKLTLALRRRGDYWIAGLHRFDDPARIFPLSDCPITESGVVSVWKEILLAEALLPDADELRGSVRVAPSGGGATFLLHGGLRWPDSEKFLDAVPSLRALWWEPEGGERRLVEDRRDVSTPAASFGQVNPEVAKEMHRHVLERIRSYAPKKVVDGYAGVGDTAAELAADGVQVTAIELDAEASLWSALRLPPPSRALQGRVEKLLGDALPADVVVVNPPRAGLDAKVSEILQAGASNLKAVIYVSCDPATLARDLSRLPDFRIASMQPFDMFPQTAHVETVCELASAR